jgi:hypothetical protein
MQVRKSTAVLSVLVLVFGATSVWLWRAQEQERSDRPQAEVAQSPGSNDRVVASPVPTEPAPAPAVVQDGHEYFDQTRFNRGLIQSGDDPRLRQSAEYMEARREYFESNFDANYPDLVRVLGVPIETAYRVVELSVEQQLRESGIRIYKTREGDFDLELQQKTQQADAEIAALIGESKLRQWKDYEASLSERYQVRQLRFELMDSSDPLESDKAESLIRALHDERQRIEQDLGPAIVDSESDTEFEAESERRSLKAAEKVLSSYQFQAFRKMLEQQRAARSAREQMERAGMEALK